MGPTTIDEDRSEGQADRDPRMWHALYELGDVRAAFGQEVADNDGWSKAEDETGGLGASRSRLRKMLDGGEKGRWRRLAHATIEAVSGVEILGAQAPHLHDMTNLVTRRLRAALATGTKITLPPTLLLGPPGVGKSWYMAHLAQVLGVPFRLYPMNLSTLSDGLSGSHPCWRSSAPGLVARTLLQEQVANCLVLVDEADKPTPSHRDGDAYRPLYALLEPECARNFCDENLQMPIDASAVMWVMSANDTGPLPVPILDRLVVVEVPDMSREDRMAVVSSIYADANRRYGGYFDPAPSFDLLMCLAVGNARRARLAVEDAMARAAAAGRHAVTTADVAGTAMRSGQVLRH